MRKSHREKLSNLPIYDFDPWRIKENEYQLENNHRNETIFALGNGYMGVRGKLEEDYSGPPGSSTPGTYINGIYGSEKIIYGEKAPKQPELSQTIVNLANWLKINLYLEDEKFDMFVGNIEGYERVLDMRKGILNRHLIWTSPGGKKVELNICRFLSFPSPHLGLIEYKVKPLNFSGQVRVASGIDGNVKNHHTFRNPTVLETIESEISDPASFIIQRVKSTGISIGLGMINRLQPNEGSLISSGSNCQDNMIAEEFVVNLDQGEEMVLNKYISFYTFQERKSMGLASTVQMEVEKAAQQGYQYLLAEHKSYLNKFWETTDLKIKGDSAIDQAFRFSVFHLLQNTGRDAITNAAAKGVTGEFYEGHYFWDTETYILPFFLYNRPEIARSMLLFRYNTLDRARLNARRVNLEGALFPWRTINGDEASSFFMGSTVQFHIDADITYAIKLYLDSTKDFEFLYYFAAEIVFETARMWASRGCFIEMRNNQFCLNEVCGPDEYKPGVSNNCYTNYMAKFNLEYALKVYKLLEVQAPDRLTELKEKIDLQEEELKLWKTAADNMFLPYNKELGIHPQDDSFLYKMYIDIDSIPEEEFPLVDNWHPLSIWRYQLIKQADVLLLMLLLGDKFNLVEKKANYDFYDPRTTHDSSLSPAIYSIIASEIGYYDEAYNYFKQTARLDLDDYNGNTYKGVHLACMGGTWMVLVQGFAGMRNYDGQLFFKPYLPDNWEGYQFKIRFQGSQILVKVEPDYVYYQLLEGNPLTIYHNQEEITINKEGKKRGHTSQATRTNS